MAQKVVPPCSALRCPAKTATETHVGLRGHAQKTVVTVSARSGHGGRDRPEIGAPRAVLVRSAARFGLWAQLWGVPIVPQRALARLALWAVNANVGGRLGRGLLRSLGTYGGQHSRSSRVPPRGQQKRWKPSDSSARSRPPVRPESQRSARAIYRPRRRGLPLFTDLARAARLRALRRASSWALRRALTLACLALQSGHQSWP